MVLGDGYTTDKLRKRTKVYCKKNKKKSTKKPDKPWKKR